MADSRHIIAFIFRHENYIQEADMDLPYEQLFAKAKAQGVVVLPGDKGGPTLCGITLSTYNTYCAKFGKPKATPETFLQMTAQDWLGVFEYLFWNKCNGSAIESQAAADMLVDWTWTSGAWAIKRMQRMIGVKDDGIVGSKTIAALNREARKDRFMEHFLAERMAYYVGIADRDPVQRKFLNGWINRAFDCWRWK